ncbi:MAG: intradiol ring-cleavage dioxygenase [Paracoccus sp. (in: a-proteobacteria)]
MTTRRNLLKFLSTSPAIGLGAALPTALQAEAASAGLLTGNVCTLMPEVTEGPYYIDPGLVRRDIREDKQGVSLKMRMQVVTADCQPVGNVRVDIWHCDAQGNYSGFLGQGSDTAEDTEDQTFLRGTQMTDDGGVVSFQTIYPGWYRGRTTHIHFKVFLDEKTVLTGQVFFPDALSQYIFDNDIEYIRSGSRDTVNRNDNIAAEAGEGAYAYLREQADGYDAVLVIGIDPAAKSQQGGDMGMGGDRPPEPPPEDAGGPSSGDTDELPAAGSLIPGRE